MYIIISFFSFLCPWQLFLETAEECCKNHNVQPTQVFLQKMIQTYEMMIVRHGYAEFQFHFLHVLMSLLAFNMS